MGKWQLSNFCSSPGHVWGQGRGREAKERMDLI